MCYIIYSILIPFVGCEIHYNVVGRGPASLNSFTGTSIYHLKRAIKLEEELPTAASLLKLSVGKPDGEKEDLDELQKVFREGKSFNLSRLVKEYEIDVDNPISVELPSK